ncbi:MAG: ACT domain-containing protein [Clostridia bacterium]
MAIGKKQFEVRQMTGASKAVVTVLGFDRKGIIAKVSGVLYERGVNILDISQTVLDGCFSMVLMADISEPIGSFTDLSDDLNALGEKLGLQIRIQKSEIFESMHQL